jgi:hypothetical protein
MTMSYLTCLERTSLMYEQVMFYVKYNALKYYFTKI